MDATLGNVSIELTLYGCVDFVCITESTPNITRSLVMESALAVVVGHFVVLYKGRTNIAL